MRKLIFGAVLGLLGLGIAAPAPASAQPVFELRVGWDRHGWRPPPPRYYAPPHRPRYYAPPPRYYYPPPPPVYYAPPPPRYYGPPPRHWDRPRHHRHW
ncbi:MAG TPA: hypothetical protein VGN96_14650 [Roseococcus sp.]|jgi:hypothetical protein|nr:hypothetical protein [Roseococcus sp.]